LKKDNTTISAEMERDLLIRWKQHHDYNARNEVVRGNMSKIRFIAKKCIQGKIPDEDTLQQAYLAALIAARHWKPEKNVRFLTYAQPWIRALIRNAKINPIHFGNPSAVCIAMAKMSEAHRMNLPITLPNLKRLGASPSISSIAIALSSYKFFPDKIDEIEGDTDLQISCEQKVQRIAIEEIVSKLPPREQLIARERILSPTPQTRDSLSDKIGVTAERIRQLELKIFQKIKKKIILHYKKDELL
jgi:RNA polymerase sigma-32 factor